MNGDRPVTEQRAERHPKTIWILTHNRVGDLQQMQALARALGWPTTVKRLVFRPLNVPVLARLLLNRRKSDPIGPPWPDLLLCAEARASVIALDIRQRSKGAVKIVCLGRPAGSADRFDLVLTTPQYRLPKLRQVIELPLPIVGDEREIPTDSLPLDLAGLSEMPRPLTAVLTGGTSLPERFDECAAACLVQSLLDHVRDSRGSLLIVTSPRTSKPAADALMRLIRPPHVVHLWNETAGDTYPRLLALADEIVVTSDSVSMAADALATGKPVSIYRLPRQWTLKHRLIERLYQLSAKNTPLWLTPVKYLFETGLIEPRADRQLLFDRLVAEGRLRWFGEEDWVRGHSARDVAQIEIAAESVSGLFSPVRTQ